MRLSARLQAIADLVEKGTAVADIGTDHAYLPIFLVQEKVVSRAVAGEVSRGPYKAAEHAINTVGLHDSISLRLGNGLQVLTPGEVNTAVIAGMGGATIIDILLGAPDVVAALNRLIVQPMIAAASVRRWFTDNGWRIIDEVLVLDDGKLYEIIAAEQGHVVENETILDEIGPILWKKKPPLLHVHINHLISQTKRVLEEMTAGKNYSAKYYEYLEKLRRLEAKKACL